MTERTDTRETGMPGEPSILRAMRITCPGSTWQAIPDYIDILRTAHAALREENERLQAKLSEAEQVRDLAIEGSRKQMVRAEALQDKLYAKKQQIVMERLQIIEALNGRPSEQPLHERVAALRADLDAAMGAVRVPESKFFLRYNKETKQIEKVSRHNGMVVESFDPPKE